jgi:hypothetical protein
MHRHEVYNDLCFLLQKELNEALNKAWQNQSFRQGRLAQ